MGDLHVPPRPGPLMDPASATAAPTPVTPGGAGAASEITRTRRTGLAGAVCRRSLGPTTGPREHRPHRRPSAEDHLSVEVTGTARVKACPLGPGRSARPYEGGFHLYDGKLPNVVHRHEAPPGARPGRDDLPALQPTTEPDSSRGDRHPRREAHDAREQAEQAASRPVCAVCGARFTDPRWKVIEPAGWGTPRETTRTCATTASGGALVPSVKPSRPAPRACLFDRLE